MGDCVNIEAFSTPDRGTIVGLWRRAQTTIMYRIRSADNVYYMMHYHRLVNRVSPQEYWRETRGHLTSSHSSMWDNVPLWKTEGVNRDFSHPSHPLHGAILALLESSKQAIASIEGKLRSEMLSKSNTVKPGTKEQIQHLLQQTGCLFLFYRQVKVDEKTKDVLDFEAAEAKRAEEDDFKADGGDKGV